MKTLSFITLLVCMSFFKVNAQEFRGIVLQHTYKKKAIKVPEYKKIKVFFKDRRQTMDGNFSLESKTEIKINDQLINLKDISKIKAKNIAMPIAGTMLMGVGGSIIGVAVSQSSNYNQTRNTVFGSVIASIPIMFGAIMATSRKTYVFEKEWNPVIYDGDLQQLPAPDWLEKEIAMKEAGIERGLYITHKTYQNNGVERFVEENKTIKVYTRDVVARTGKTVTDARTGPFTVIDNNTIKVGAQIIPLDIVFAIRAPKSFDSRHYKFTAEDGIQIVKSDSKESPWTITKEKSTQQADTNVVVTKLDLNVTRTHHPAPKSDTLVEDKAVSNVPIKNEKPKTEKGTEPKPKGKNPWVKE